MNVHPTEKSWSVMTTNPMQGMCSAGSSLATLGGVATSSPATSLGAASAAVAGASAFVSTPPPDASLRQVTSGGGEPDDRSFQTANHLVQLPLGILHSTDEINRTLQAIEALPVSLAEKWRKIEALDLNPFVTGSQLSGDFRLLIDMADDLSALRYARIDRALSAEDLNGRIEFPGDEGLTPLATIPSPTLVFSAFDVARHASPESAEMITQLMMYGRRLSRHRGVTVSWDQAVDRKVWTFNIDTANILREIFNDKQLRSHRARRIMEVGVGGGSTITTLARKLPEVEEIIGTDINPYALMCTQRNVQPWLRPNQRLSLYLGKGIRTIDYPVDILVVNPPYIPHRERPDAVDPYRGTGLIREVIEVGPERLSRDHPDAAIYLGMSNLAYRDLRDYLRMRDDITVERLGEELEVPLKIFNISENRDWLDFLVREHGLIDDPARLQTHGYRYWHRISVLKIMRR